jgi:hypothetical protein
MTPVPVNTGLDFVLIAANGPILAPHGEWTAMLGLNSDGQLEIGAPPTGTRQFEWSEG